MKRITIVMALVAGLLTVLPAASPAAATPLEEPVTVRQSDLGGWALDSGSCRDGEPSGTMSFVTGPEAPPLGEGSLLLAIGRDAATRHTASFSTVAGAPIAAITTLSYATYVADAGRPAPHLSVHLDLDGDDVRDDTYRFDPPLEGLAPEWQAWEVLNGSLVGSDGEPTSWAGIVDKNPDAALAEQALSVGVGCGDGWENVVANVDAVAIAVDGDDERTGSYDFEPNAAGISVDDLSVPEGDAGVGRVTLSEAAAEDVTATVTFTDGSATADADHAFVPVPVAIPSGSLEATFDVPTRADDVDEDDETFTLSLTDVVGADTVDATATVTITDDDDPPVVTLAPVSGVEPPTGSSTVTVPVSLSGPSGRSVSVAYSTSGSTAVSGVDFAPASGSVVVPAGSTSASIPVSVYGDLLLEATESFSVLVGEVTNASVAPMTSAAVAIADDDAGRSSTFHVDDAVATEAGALRFRIWRTGDRSGTASVTAVTAAASAASPPATAGADYTAIAARTVSFAHNQLFADVTVTTAGDAIDEVNEHLVLNLSAAVHAVVADAQALGTIVDDDGPVTAGPVSWVRVGNAELRTEGNTGNTGRRNLRFEVARSGAVDAAASVSFGTGSLTATSAVDFVATTGTLSFAPGETVKWVDVPVVGDLVPEFPETFSLRLTSATGVVLADVAGTGTIVDDDAGAPAQLSVSDITVTEGAAGVTTPATFTIRRVGTTDERVSVRWATAAPGAPHTAATAASDYTAVPSGTVTFLRGESEKTVSVNVVGDSRDEVNEAFGIALTSPTQVVVPDPLAVATIVDDDGPVTQPVSTFVAVTDAVPVREGASQELRIIRTGDLSGTSTVTYAAANGLARVGVDLTAPSAGSTVTFGPGESLKTVAIATIGDVVTETAETYVLKLSSPSGASIVDASGTAAIVDDDGLLVRALPVAVNEGDTPSSADDQVTLSSIAASPVSVDVATADGTATAPSDYTATAVSLTFAPGETTKTVSIPIVGDDTDEGDELLHVRLTNAVGALTENGTVTLTNDDTVGITVDDATVAEAGGTATVTVRLTAQAATTVTVGYATGDGDATAPADYTATSGSLSFPPGTTVRTFTVPVVSDTRDEPDERFRIGLAGASGASLVDSTADVLVVDDDLPPVVTLGDVSVLEHEGTARVPVTLSAASGRSITVEGWFADGSATVPDDYTGSMSALTLAPGSTSGVLTVPIVDTIGCEGTQTMTVDALVANATAGDVSGLVSIGDIDCGGITVHDLVVDESAGTASVRVTLDEPRSVRVTASFTTADGSAIADGTNNADGADYTPTTGTVMFLPGQTERIVAVPVLDSGTCEPVEHLVVRISSPLGAPLARAEGRLLVADAADCPGFVGGRVTVDEGQIARVPVTLGTLPSAPVTVGFATAEASATFPADYLNVTGTLTFARGERTKWVSVPTQAGSGCEDVEHLLVVLSGGAGAPVSRPAGRVAIVDTSGVCFSVNDVQVQEGAPAQFTVTAFPAPTQAVSVSVATMDGTAHRNGFANPDYTTTTGTLTFQPGQTSRTFGVATNDTGSGGGCEGPETFHAVLSGAGPGGQISDPKGVATIVDFPADCSAGGVVVEDKLTSEGALNAVFTIRLSAPQGSSVTVSLVTMEGTATPGADYTTTAGSVTFAPGEVTKTFSVPVIDGASCEQNEVFSVRVTSTSIGIADGWGVGTIDDLDC